MTVPPARPARAGLRRLRFARTAAVMLLAVSLGACSSLFGKDDTPPDEPADRLYNEGLYLLNSKRRIRRRRSRSSKRSTASTPIRNGRASR